MGATPLPQHHEQSIETSSHAPELRQRYHNHHNTNTMTPIIQNNIRHQLDDADIAAGAEKETTINTNNYDTVETTVWVKDNSNKSIDNNNIQSPPNSKHGNIHPILVLGYDISHLPSSSQFLLCACGVFSFSLLYGYLQELIAVHLCNRQLGLFLAMAQFSGYTFWSYFLRNFVERKKNQIYKNYNNNIVAPQGSKVPIEIYIGISLLRALDLGMTNLAMQFINYPAKTLLKSSRVCWTMLFGVLIARRRYGARDYAVVGLMVLGLSVFMHADSKSSAVFEPIGVCMLIISLMCDGAVSNTSEAIMNKYHVGQDEFIFSMYSIALVAITVAAFLKGELVQGMQFLSVPGTYDEILNQEPPTWTVGAKIFTIISFSTLGFFASSCSAAITKNFGALTMSITSTARKATTLFLSFMLFPNKCTMEHIFGILVFITALLGKSMKHGAKSAKDHIDVEMNEDKEEDGEESVHMRRVDSGYSIFEVC